VHLANRRRIVSNLRRTRWSTCSSFAACVGVSLVGFLSLPTQATAAEANEAATVVGLSGQPLNLNFERGSLADWRAEGDAFKSQPVRGDTVHARRADAHSRHEGQFWIGTFEIAGDAPQGTLTSAPFKVIEPFASFLVGGGRHDDTCVEIVRERDGRVLFRASGMNDESMRRVVVDLTPHVDETVFLRLVDRRSNGWGHINFDDFRLHAEEPDVPAEDRIPPLDRFDHAGLSPEDAAATMTSAEGFEIKLFAGEPDVQQPIAMAIDDSGRLWVAEAYSYPRRVPDEEARDRILIFEDSDGDGKFDHRKVFAEKLNLVSGLEVGFGGVWVGAAPYLMFIPDRDGDDVPDGEPEILLDGWAWHDTHETLNAFIWGPDGWLYGCHGVFTHSRVGKPGTPKSRRTPINAGIWRYHPTEHRFEVFAHGTSNPWGVDFNDVGQAFCTACVIPHLFHMIPGARYQRQAGSHFNRYTYADIQTIADHRHWLGHSPHLGNARSSAAGGGHAHAGAMIYLGGRWPAEYRDQIFMNNIHGARINMDRLAAAGSGYVGSHGPDFILANDQWSQILNLRYGPDGQAYMIDWYDKNQCHHGQPGVHDRSNGRIFKICYQDGKPDTLLVADLKTRSDAELVKLQLSSNDWFVRHARRILAERAADGTLAGATLELLAKIAFEHQDPTRRLRGLWALRVAAGLSGKQLQQAMEDESPHVRGWAIRLAAEDGRIDSPTLVRCVELAHSDPSPVVRLELASAAGRIPRSDRWALLEALSAHDEDAEDHNLPLMNWYALEPLVDVDADRALSIAEGSPLPNLLSFAVRRVSALGTPKATNLLVQHLGRSESPEQQLVYLSAFEEGSRGQRQLDMPAAWQKVGPQLLASSHARVRQMALSLAVKFGDPQALAQLRKTLADADADLPARRQALATLREIKDEQLAGTLHLLLADANLRSEALRALAAFDHQETPERILTIYADLPSGERRDALATLASRTGYATALLDSIGEGNVPTGDLTADLVRQMRNLKDKTIEARLAEVWGTVRDTPEEKARQIAEYKKLLSEKKETDPWLGRAVYAKTCAQCHKLFGTGGNVGPELTGSNRADLDYLLGNVLDPSALIAKDYRATTLATVDGRVVTGIVRQADDRAVTIQTEKETLVIPRDEIDEMAESPKSMMPDDLLRPLSEPQVRALVAYMASPAQVPMLATADNVQSLFNGQDLSGWTGDTELWSVENGEIVGRSPGIRHNAFLISDLAVSDFRLSLEVKLVDNRGNSGIQFRSEALPGGEVRGYQADIGQGWWGKLYEELARGMLWNEGGDSHVKPGDWNTYEIEAIGSRVRTWLNGQLCVDLNDPPGARRGILALQIHSGPAMEVRFRNLEITLNPQDELARRDGDESQP